VSYQPEHTLYFNDQGFRWYSSILVLVRESHIALYAYHATLPKNQLQNFSQKKKNSSQRVRNLFTMLPSEHKVHPKSSTSVPCCTIPTVHFPSNYLLLIPTFLPCYHPTFTRRTSGHCLRTFRAVNLPHPPPPVTTSAVYLTESPSILLPLLSFVKLQNAKQEQGKW